MVLGQPLVTIIDTKGAELSVQAEESGLAGEIARSLSELIGLHSPSVSVLLGQGTGGAALALLPAARTIAAQNSWLSPLPAVGASAIMHRSTSYAPQVAHQQKIGVASLCGFGLMDHVVDELDDSAARPREFCHELGAAIAAEISLPMAIPEADRLERRQKKFQSLGGGGSSPLVLRSRTPGPVRQLLSSRPRAPLPAQSRKPAAVRRHFGLQGLRTLPICHPPRVRWDATITTR